MPWSLLLLLAVSKLLLAQDDRPLDPNMSFISPVPAGPKYGTNQSVYLDNPIWQWETPQTLRWVANCSVNISLVQQGPTASQYRITSNNAQNSFPWDGSHGDLALKDGNVFFLAVWNVSKPLGSGVIFYSHYFNATDASAASASSASSTTDVSATPASSPPTSSLSSSSPRSSSVNTSTSASQTGTSAAPVGVGSSSSSNSNAAALGGGLGGGLGGALILVGAAAAYFFLRKRNKAKEASPGTDSSHAKMGPSYGELPAHSVGPEMEGHYTGQYPEHRIAAQLP